MSVQINKHIPDILLSGNPTATPGNKFRYCWQAKLNVQLATTSLSLFSIQQQGGQVAVFLLRSFMCLCLSDHSQNGQFSLSEALTAAVQVSYVATIFPFPYPKQLLQSTQDISNIDSILQKITSPSRVVLFFCESVITQELFWPDLHFLMLPARKPD